MKPLDPRVLPHLRPARVQLGAALLLGALGGLLALAQAFALGGFLVRLVGGSDWRVAAGWLLGVVATRAVVSWAADTTSTAAAGRVSTALRRRVLGAAVQMVPERLARLRTGELTLVATRGAAAVEPYLTRYLPALVLAAVLPLATLVAITCLDPLSGLVVLVTLPLLPLFAALVGLATRDRAERQWRELSLLAGHFVDVVRGLPTLVSHRRAGAQSSTIRGVSERHRLATLDTLRLAFASSLVLELVATLSVALVAVLVGLRLAAGSLDLSTALVVLLLAPEAYWPLRRVGAEFHAAAEGVAAFEAVDAVLAEPHAEPRSAADDGRLAVADLDLGYGTHVVLRGLSHDFSTGVTAVTGPSGCGKSTLLLALAGELRPLGGSVVAPGPADVAWSPQRPWLTSGSVADNVRTGRPRASDAEVWSALEQVDLGATVRALPDGLETALGEDGAGLSAGQRARLALARVVISDRPVVLLDEPTAHLDAASEQVLLDTLRRLGRTRTVVVVAHRASVLDIADHVLALPAAAPTGQPGPTPASSTRGAVRRDGEAATQDRAPRPVGRLATLLGSASLLCGVALSATAGWLITRASEHPPVLYLTVAIVGVRLFGLTRPVLRYAERLISHDAALRLLARRRVEVFDALVPLTPGALGAGRGDLLSAVVDDVETVVDHRLRVQEPVRCAVVVVVVTAVVTGLIAPVVAAVVLGVGAVAAGSAAAVLVATSSTRAAVVTARAELSCRCAALLASVRQLDRWQATDAALAGVDEASAGLRRATRSGTRTSALSRAAVLTACGAAPVAVGAWTEPGAVSPAVLALLCLVPLALVDTLLPLPDAAALAPRTRAAARRLEEIASRRPLVSEPTHTRGRSGSDVALRGVTAGWSAHPVLHDLDLDVRAGSRVVVTGPSGSGKSTVAALLLRFLDPVAGQVLVGGADLRATPLDDVRRVVGLVEDDPYVFTTTLAENIRLARPDATDEEVSAALRRAGLGPWLAALPHGLTTMVGEGQHQVSGGERARLGLSRVLLAEPQVLVLDEPTAHLDAATAQSVTAGILNAAAGRSLVWITHDRDLVDASDQVLDLGADPAHRTTPQHSSPSPPSGHPAAVASASR